MQDVSNSYETCRELGQDGVPDIGDMSSAAYSRDVLFNVSETQRQRIHDIDVALEQIAKGEYGICMSCGEEISPRRMEVRPRQLVPPTVADYIEEHGLYRTTSSSRSQ